MKFEKERSQIVLQRALWECYFCRRKELDISEKTKVFAEKNISTEKEILEIGLGPVKREGWKIKIILN